MICNHCGAPIEADALECPYCHRPSPVAAASEAARLAAAKAAAAQAQAGAAAQKAASARRIDSLASQTLWLAVVGLVVCCAPVGLAAAVQGWRARKLAEAAAVPLPGRAVVGLALALFGFVSSIGFFTYMFIDIGREQEAADRRIAEIEKTVAAEVGAPTLTQATACALAEAHARRTGYDGNPGYALKGFECRGLIQQEGQAAHLDDFRFVWRSSTPYELHVCFKRGAAWYVTEMRKGPHAAAGR